MPQTIENPQSEREKVESWRLHVLIEAGYPLPLAEKLAHSEICTGLSNSYAPAAASRPRPRSSSEHLTRGPVTVGS
jgi:hypothetical protein